MAEAGRQAPVGERSKVSASLPFDGELLTGVNTATFRGMAEA